MTGGVRHATANATSVPAIAAAATGLSRVPVVDGSVPLLGARA